jgi:DNA-binding transcriptional ArsR family regulator
LTDHETRYNISILADTNIPMGKIEKIAEVFKALSDPTRLKLIKLLSKCSAENVITGVCEGGPLCVNALAHKLGVSQSAVSQHLRVLRQAGLVRGARQGNFMHYSIDPTGYEKWQKGLVETFGKDLTQGK